jgi:hypothetical protein
LNYNLLEHLKSYNHLPTIWDSCRKKTEKFQTQNLKKIFTMLLKVNFKMFFLKYVEIKYSLQTHTFFAKQLLSDTKNAFDSACASLIACPDLPEEAGRGIS